MVKGIAQILPSDSDDWVRLKTPYDPTFVEKLKKSVDWKKRCWNKQNKEWQVHIDFLDVAIRIMSECYDDVVSELSQHHEDISACDDYEVLYMLPNAPKKVIIAVYKCLAKVYHPDVPGGSSAKMSKLNEAYSNIKKNFRK